jgi:prevent-host-death family protein
MRYEIVLREVALAKVKDDLSKYSRLAADEEIVITRHGRPARVIIGFESDEDWFDYRLEHHRSSYGESLLPERLWNRVTEVAWKNLGMSV